MTTDEICLKCGWPTDKGVSHNQKATGDDRITCNDNNCGKRTDFVCVHADGSKTLTCPIGHRHRVL